MKDKIYIVISAYKEENSITDVIEDLHNYGYHNIVVVNDGSPDRTQQILDKIREKQMKRFKQIHILNHIVNRGQGAGLKTGIEYALTQGANIIVTFDGDGQHRAKDIWKLIHPILIKEYDVVIGSRFLDEISIKNIPWTRRILLKVSTKIIYLFYGLRMTDAHNGLRAFSKKASKQIKFVSDRMAYASEIMELIQQKKLKFMEVPVIIKYSNEIMAKGHSSLLGAFVILKTMIWLKLKKPKENELTKLVRWLAIQNAKKTN